jgi:hypothetical protein
VLGKKFVIHSRLVIKAVEVPRRNKLDEVPVALIVLAEEDQMIRARGIGTPVLAAIGRYVDFAADDWLHAVGDRLMVKGRSGKKIAVIGDGDRGHSAPRGLGRQFTDLAGAIEKRVVCVHMEMDKFRMGPDIVSALIFTRLDRGSECNRKMLWGHTYRTCKTRF